MSKLSFRRLCAAALTLMLAAGTLSIHTRAAQAAPAIFTQLVATDVTLDETRFEYTGQEIRPNVTVRAGGKLLTLNEHYYLDYADNIEVGEGKVIVTGIATAGYAGTVEHPFFITEKAAQEPEFTLIELKGTDVMLEQTELLYTGAFLEPGVTVTVNGKTLVKDTDYTLEYLNNRDPGTATVIVRGIATASETVGYTGEVRIDFTIQPRTEDTYPLVELKQEHVTIDGKQFVYTGQPIEPKITVTVDGKVLTAGKDYQLHYSSNVQPGTGIATVTGIATATEAGGYTGQVQVKFTITESETEEDGGTPAPEYKITKGDGSTWYQGSSSALSFTVNGKYADFSGVSVNGKQLSAGDYSAKEGTVVLLKNEYLKKLNTGKYTVTFHFEDGSAEGIFEIAAATDNPKTGDSIYLWTAMMTFSLAALALLHKRKAL